MTTAAPRSLCDEDALEQLGVHGVQALEWLVHDEQIRLIHDGRDELRTLVHAA